MTASRSLQFETEQQVIDEIARLRRGYHQSANWNLPQICWHVSLPIEKHLAPPTPMDLAPTPDQAAKKAAFVDYIIANRSAPPQARNAPQQFIPPASASDADIERYIKQLHRLQKYSQPRVMMGPVGPVTIAEFRACNIYHAAHHLSFLVPKVEKRNLNFSDFDQVKHDVTMLRSSPHTQLGNWTLNQIAWHLHTAINSQLNTPAAPATEDQINARAILSQIIAGSPFPEKITAPDFLTPSISATASDIDSLLAILDRAAAHKNEPVTHRRFGPLSLAEYKKLCLAHCAHHLNYLVPDRHIA